MKEIERTDKDRWEEFTESDIRAIKRKQCIKCIYFRGGTGDAIATGTCEYSRIKKHRRGCRPDRCDKFEPKKRRRQQLVKRG